LAVFCGPTLRSMNTRRCSLLFRSFHAARLGGKRRRAAQGWRGHCGFADPMDCAYRQARCALGLSGVML
jgi:hypothetical protein